MAVSFSLADITADIARRCNTPTFTTTTNTSSGMVAYWIGQSARSLSAILQAAHCEDNDLVTTDTITTVAGFDLVSLPPGCSDLHAVLWHKSPTEYRVLAPASLDDLACTSEAEGAWEIQPRYRLEGNLLRLIPASTETETLTLFYTRHLETSGQTAIQSRLDADLWITLDVAVKVLQSKNRDATALQAEKLALQAQMTSAARRRDAFGASTIRDVRRVGRLNSRRDAWWRY